MLEETIAGWPASRGKNLYLKLLSGGRLTPRQTIEAKCAERCGGFRDGRVDCGVELCPSYPYMPYRGKATEASALTVDIEESMGLAG